MRRLNYRYYSWPGTDWMSAFFFTRQELGKPANLAGVYDITAAAIYKGPVGSPTPLGWYLAEGLCHEPSQWHFGIALGSCIAVWSQQHCITNENEKRRKDFFFFFLIFVSWFLHVALCLWHPSVAPAQNSEPCGDCWFIQQHALLPHRLLL